MCIFCDIIHGKLEGYIIYRNKFATVILDKYPISPGHTLILSNTHYENFLEVSHEDICEISKVINAVAKAVKDSVNAEGIRVLTNVGKSAGQVIFHFHTHVIPTWDDPPEEFKGFEPRKEQGKEYYESLKNVISYNLRKYL
ncbi:MAG: histidine triad nucleotide-binding protein [Candidatus Aramenus sulfurataquae]|jgi:histidine triad (HIT) family protein|uniref:HIT family hydrolase n=2 Tax=Candidatus Aramenus sulfurataquae TaxID=1326980 RepID=W7KMP7_9CREN|nr:MAG: histidine triad nucleotide-binding protein [Candidatus Aramenus sulfurataquae]MCL7343739.1 HIT family protein [Candidatus Aramenus sulfurataquae]